MNRSRHHSTPVLKPVLGPVLGSILLLVSISACSGPDSKERFRPETPSPAVEAVQARSGTLPLEERLSGAVKAENQVAIYPEISAPVIEVLARSGEAVRRGQPLVRLEGDELQDQLRQAEAAVQLAEASADEARARVAEIEAQVSRTRALSEQELVSDMDLETQEARLNASRASAAQAVARVAQASATAEERRSALTNTVIRAPIDGTVGQRNAEVGMLADRSTLLFQIGNLDSLIVEVPLTEGMLAYIDEGLPVRISSPSLGEDTLRATLSRISPFLQETSFSTIGEIDVENLAGRLRPGMFVTVDVLYGETERATLIPASAAWEDPGTGLIGSFVVSGETRSEGIVPTSLEVPKETMAVEFRTLEVLARGRHVLGVRGVEPDEWVVTVGQNLLADAGEDVRAHVRTTAWDKVIDLQSLQREDLLDEFLAKQQRLARTIGVQPPSTEEFLSVTEGSRAPMPAAAPSPPLAP